MKYLLLVLAILFSDIAFADTATLSEGSFATPEPTPVCQPSPCTCDDLLEDTTGLKGVFNIQGEGDVLFEEGEIVKNSDDCHVQFNGVCKAPPATCEFFKGTISPGKGNITKTEGIKAGINEIEGGTNYYGDGATYNENLKSSSLSILNAKGLSCLDNFVQDTLTICNDYASIRQEFNADGSVDTAGKNAYDASYRASCFAIALTQKFFLDLDSDSDNFGFKSTRVKNGSNQEVTFYHKQRGDSTSYEAITPDKTTEAWTTYYSEDGLQVDSGTCNTLVRGAPYNYLCRFVEEGETDSNKDKCFHDGTGYIEVKLDGYSDLSNMIEANGRTRCDTGEFYFDSDCNPVSADKVKDLCGEIDPSFQIGYDSTSPISLILDAKHDINKDVVFTKFSLDPSKPYAKWSAWKASKKAPLLVYDPEHKGVIKDATQLFGNWTFGGKQRASQNLIKADLKWANGFEALATLDRDFDGKLNGDELTDLALWFDVNRDGISQKGEVKSLGEVGIVTLYFNGYAEDKVGDLRLDIGYEREINGKTEQGTSVDWYEVTAATKAELVDYYTDLLRGDNKTIIKELQPPVATAIKNVSAFEGTWDWYVDEKDLKDNSPTKGMFVLFQIGEKGIAGYTLAEKIFVKSPRARLNSQVRVQGIEGRIMNANEMRFGFSMGNSYVSSKAVLSKDGKSLTGSTVVQIAGAKSLAYSWTAQRHQ